MSGKTDKKVVEFISSREADKRIVASIVLINEAHTVALLKAGITNRREAARLFRELRQLERQIPQGGDGEDYHLYVEEVLTKRLGPELGGKIHTGKSRNDQVATAIRMSLREALLTLSDNVLRLADKLLVEASKHADTFFVGYTHQQPAQPITYGHYLVSIVDPLLRDTDRTIQNYHRVNMSPMGSGALAGSSFKLDRLLVAQLLGFDGLVENSLDAVGGRDFLLETLAVCGEIGSDLSRVAQDWIFYSSSDVGLLELSAEYSSTSSMMPQKKNPDPLELVRAKCANVAGSFSTAVTMMHSLPSGYNLDFQELTPIAWKAIDTICSCLSIMTGAADHIQPLKDLANRYQIKFTVATEVANSLVRETNAPFREAYRWTGEAVRTALRDHKTLNDLSQSEWSKITGRPFDVKTFRIIQKTADPRSSPGRYQTEGSPNPREVRKMIRTRKQRIRKNQRIIKALRGQVQNATRRLNHIL